MFGSNAMLTGGNSPALQIICILAAVAVIVLFLFWMMRDSPEDRLRKNREQQQRLVDLANKKNRKLDT